MTSSLPQEVQQVFERFITTEFTTIDRRGQPISWPLTPYYRAGRPVHRRDHRARLPQEGERRGGQPQGGAAVLRSDRLRHGGRRRRCSCRARPTSTTATSRRTASATRASRRRSCRRRRSMLPPEPLQRLFSFYFTRLYVHVRPERVYVWPGGDVTREPELFDTHMEEVRSGHDEEPESEPPRPGRRPASGTRVSTSWARATRRRCCRSWPRTAFRSRARADLGRPGRAPHPDRSRRAGRAGAARAACLIAHDHGPASRGSRTSRCAATSWRRTAAGRSCRTG